MIYGHSQNLADAMPLIRKMRPEYWKAIDPDDTPAAECQGMGVKLIVRHFGVWDNAAIFVEHCRQQSWFPYAWAIETNNEPGVGDPEFMGDCVWRLRLLGKECIVGQWGNGHDGFPVPGATYYGCHEYGWPMVNTQAPWMAFRHESWFPAIQAQNPDAKLFITEFGVTQAAINGPDIGYKTGQLTPAQYWASLKAYDNALDESYVLGSFVFQTGGFSDWNTFEVLGTAVEVLMALQEPVPAPPEGGDMPYEFILGFKAKAEELGEAVVGVPEQDEFAYHESGTGQHLFTMQKSTKGVMVYVPGGSTLFLPGK